LLLVYRRRKLYNILHKKCDKASLICYFSCDAKIIRSDNMAKNKPAFQSNNSKYANGQAAKGASKTAAPVPKKPVRGNSRGK
jgi:hypothetical protein